MKEGTNFTYLAFKKPKSRANIRKSEVENSKFLQKVEPIEMSFCANVFQEESPMTYEELYLIYVDQVKDLIARMNSQFKVIMIDPHYFEKRYRPLES